MLNKTLLAVAFAAVTTSAIANTTVVGKLTATDSVVLNPGAASQHVSGSALPYLIGDMVSTSSASANLLLNAGTVSINIAPESKLTVEEISPLKINLDQGAASFETQSNSVVVTTDTNTVTVSSESNVSGILINKDGELTIVSKDSNLNVVDQNGLTSNIQVGKALVIGAQGSPSSIDVQAPDGGVSGAAIAALVGAGVGAIILLNDDDDDDDSASPSQ